MTISTDILARAIIAERLNAPISFLLYLEQVGLIYSRRNQDESWGYDEIIISRIEWIVSLLNQSVSYKTIWSMLREQQKEHTKWRGYATLPPNPFSE